jgi:hypothetical protein
MYRCRLPAACHMIVVMTGKTRDISQSIAAGISELSPGWRAWHDPETGRWHARREGGFAEEMGGTLVAMVTADDAAGLIAAIDTQSALALELKYPLWKVAQDEETGRWHAEGPGTAARPYLVDAVTAADLLARVRVAVARSQGACSH